MAGYITLQVKPMKTVQADKQDSLCLALGKAIIIFRASGHKRERPGKNDYEYYQQYWFFHYYLLVRGYSKCRGAIKNLPEDRSSLSLLTKSVLTAEFRMRIGLLTAPASVLRTGL